MVAVEKGTRFVRERRGPFASLADARAGRDGLRELFRGLAPESGYGSARSLADQHDFEIVSVGGREARPW